jgi:hypothetical protein
MMLGSTDSQILAGADKWRWTPSGTREHKFDRFVMSIYPEGWNRNFVELDLGASGDANVFAQVVAADRPRLGEILSAPIDPHIAGPKPVAQFGEHTQFVGTAIDIAILEHERPPSPANECGRRL